MKTKSIDIFKEHNLDGRVDDTWKCPFCGEDYNHIREVATVHNPDGDELRRFEGSSKIVKRATRFRRAALQIKFACESCDQNWYLILQNNKGVMLVFICEGETANWDGECNEDENESSN